MDPDQTQRIHELFRLDARIRREIARLPEKEREASTLYYIGNHSHEEIAAFLDLTRATVRNRIHAARGKLRERMTDLVEDSLKSSRPSRNDAFSERVKRLITAARAGDSKQTGELLKTDPQIATAEEEVPHWYNEKYQALHVACSEGHLDVAKKLVEAGADVNAVGKEGLTPPNSASRL